MVLLSVKDERALLKVQKFLETQSIGYAVFHEPDDDLGFTALATRAVFGEERKLFSKYPLWRIENATAQQQAGSPTAAGVSLALSSNSMPEKAEAIPSTFSESCMKPT